MAGRSSAAQQDFAGSIVSCVVVVVVLVSVKKKKRGKKKTGERYVHASRKARVSANLELFFFFFFAPPLWSAACATMRLEIWVWRCCRMRSKSMKHCAAWRFTTTASSSMLHADTSAASSSTTARLTLKSKIRCPSAAKKRRIAGDE